MVGTSVIGSQMRFIRDRDPGFDRKHTFTFDGRNFAPQIKQALSGESSIIGLSTSTDIPVNILTCTLSTDWDGKPRDRSLMMAQLSVDKDFISNFKLKLIAGGNFRGTKSDSTSFILNETAVKQTGIKDPIGKRFKLNDTDGTLIGVVKDYNITSIREPIMSLKVLGATVLNIITLLSNGFMKLILIAIVIASPIAWIGVDHWLNEFAYKVGIQWWTFVLAGLLAIITALLTIGFQSVKAGHGQPGSID